MGPKCACGLLSCAAKRGGAFPLSSEHSGWAEGSCVTSRRIHEAALRVIVSPPAGFRHFVITGEAAKIYKYTYKSP